MAVMPLETPVEETVRAVQTLSPQAQQEEVLNFVVFLQTRLAVQNTAWDEALESTTTEQAARIRARIAGQRAQATPLFDANGDLNPPKPA